MREHKYRIWDAENKEFIYFNLRRLVGHWSEIIFDPEEPSTKSGAYGGIAGEAGERSLLASAPLDEWTGLSDCHGVDIYENDLVKDGQVNKPFVVTYGDILTSDGYEADTYPVGIGFNVCPVEEGDPNTYEIIGNVHQHPEKAEL